jgi:predicted nucleic acid-binding protein
LTRMVVDASSIGRALLPDERDTLSDQITSLLESAVLVEPPHWGIECAGLILRAARRGRMSNEERASLRALLSILVEQAEIELQTRPVQAFDLAVIHHLSVYDAAYLEVALSSGLPLLTQDGALMKAANASGIELIELT